MHADNGQLTVLDPGELRHIWVILGKRHLETPGNSAWTSYSQVQRELEQERAGARGTDDPVSQVQELSDALQVREEGWQGLRETVTCAGRAHVVGLLCSPRPLGAGRHLAAHTCANKPWPVAP